MAIYVDISDGSQPGVPAYSTTGHAGTAVDPWSWDDFVGAPTGTYKIRGWRAFSSSISQSIEATLEAWSLADYGPWRIYSSGSVSLPNVTMKNCLVFVDGGNSLDVGNTVDAYVHVTSGIGLYGDDTYNTTLYCASVGGNLYGSKDIYGCVCFGVPGLFDSVLIGVTGIYTISNVATNGQAFSGASYNLTGGSGTFIDGGGNSYGFDLPSFPAWNVEDIYTYDLVPGYGVGIRGGWANPITDPVTNPQYPGSSEGIGMAQEFRNSGAANRGYYRNISNFNRDIAGRFWF